jgi:hypothetical protein
MGVIISYIEIQRSATLSPKVPHYVGPKDSINRRNKFSGVKISI